MGRLIYSAITSLDLYVADPSGRWDWSMPSADVHQFVNDLERPVGTHLYGRRMYDVMKFWAGPEAIDGQPAVMQDYAAIWRAADKIVYSRTLSAPSTPRTRIERDFDAGAVRRMKETSNSDLSIGGPEIASHAIRAGLVDEYCLFLSPVLVGGGKPALPQDVRVTLELLEVRRFDNGVVFLRYRPASAS